MSGMLDGKVVLVNGGTQGVGGAVARAAVREGTRGVVTGRRLDTGTRFAGELEALGGEVRFVQTDLADPQQARGSVMQTVAEFGRIDGLCNAAGLTTRGSLLDTSPEKPIALTVAESEEIVARLASCAVPVQIGYNRRFDPAFVAAYNEVRSGALGRLTTVRSTTMDPAPPPPAYVAASGGIAVCTTSTPCAGSSGAM